MKISVILATQNKDISILLDSLANQTYKDFEIIVVDNNEDNKRELAKYSNFLTIKYLKIEDDSLFILRNYGTLYASGDILTYPLPSTKYDINSFFNVVSEMENLKKSIIAYKVKGELSNSSSTVGLYNISSCIYPSNYFINIQDEDILLFSKDIEGISGEYDYVTRYMYEGFNVYYLSEDMIEVLDKPHFQEEEYKKYIKKEIKERNNQIAYFLYVYQIFKSKIKLFNNFKVYVINNLKNIVGAIKNVFKRS